MKKNQHVVPHNGKWGDIGEGNMRVTQTFPTQEAARIKAREIAIRHQAEVVIHRKDGRIRDKDSYGNDPFPPKG